MHHPHLTTIVALVLASCALADPPAKPIDTLEALWAGFDPRREPLDIEVLKESDEDGVHLEMVYFTGEVFEGEKTRIFGYYGRPKKVEGKIPAVLHVHGGGQTAVLDWPRFWAKRGYACLSFDFCGAANKREHYTRWGKVPADMMKIGSGIQMTPMPRHNPWFHWMLASRRGLTFLESRPEVDKNKLGVFGISVGGTLTWGVAALDERVKAAAHGKLRWIYAYPPDACQCQTTRWRTFTPQSGSASCPDLPAPKRRPV